MIGRFLVLLCLALLKGRAAEHWTSVSSGPFTVAANGNEKAARETLNTLEQLRGALGATLGKQDLKLVWPVRIVSGARSVHGWGLARDAYVGTAVAPGELARLLIEQNTARLPAGIENGLVALFSTFSAEGTRVQIGAPPQQRTRDWARVQLLVTDPVYAGRARVFFSNLTQGASLDTAYRNAFEQSAGAIEQQVDARLASASAGAVELGGKPTNPVRDFHPQAMAASEAQLVLADVALASGASTAGALYQALHGPEADEGLGLMALRAGRQGEARQRLQSAVDAGSKSARAWYELARLESAPAKAHSLLQKAAALNPLWPEPYVALAALEKDPAAKSVELAKAAALAPRDPALWRSLAEARTAAGDFTGADKAWAGAERAAADDAERVRIHQTRLDLAAQRADAEIAERKRRAAEEAQDIERVRNQTLASIRAAEAKANAELNRGRATDPSAPVADWSDLADRPVQVRGVLKRVECSGKEATLVVQNSRETLSLLLPDRTKVPVECGVQARPRRVLVKYKSQPAARAGIAGEAIAVEFR